MGGASPASVVDDLGRRACGSQSPVGSRFSPLGEEESDSESCSSEIPFEAALQVLDEEGAAEEIADTFWEEIGIPKPASRFWEKTPSDWRFPDKGMHDSVVFRCRSSPGDLDGEEPRSGVLARASTSSTPGASGATERCAFS